MRGVNLAYLAVCVDELFGVTGIADNRLVDRLKDTRALQSFAKAPSDEDNGSGYLQTLQTLNEFSNWARSPTSPHAFTTGGPDPDANPFFHTAFTAEEANILNRSNRRFVNDGISSLLGYDRKGQVVQSQDVKELDELEDPPEGPSFRNGPLVGH